MPFSDWDASSDTANGTTSGVNIAEGCDAANMNNWGRRIMTQLRAAIATALDSFLAGSSALPIANGGTAATTASAARTALGAAASGANNDITSLAGLTTALSLAQGGTGATTQAAAFAAIAVAASSLTSPGYLKLPNGLFLMWGSKAYGSGSTTITYNTELGITTGIGTFSVAVVSGGSGSDNQANGPYVSACTTTGFSVNVTAGTGSTLFWIAVGK